MKTFYLILTFLLLASCQNDDSVADLYADKSDNKIINLSADDNSGNEYNKPEEKDDGD